MKRKTTPLRGLLRIHAERDLERRSGERERTQHFALSSRPRKETVDIHFGAPEQFGLGRDQRQYAVQVLFRVALAAVPQAPVVLLEHFAQREQLLLHPRAHVARQGDALEPGEEVRRSVVPHLADEPAELLEKSVASPEAGERTQRFRCEALQHGAEIHRADGRVDRRGRGDTRAFVEPPRKPAERKHAHVPEPEEIRHRDQFAVGRIRELLRDEVDRGASVVLTSAESFETTVGLPRPCRADEEPNGHARSPPSGP